VSTVSREKQGYWPAAWEAWNRFWFRPTDPSTLSLIRVLAGAMLFYTHLVWSYDLQAFFGPDGWLPLDLMSEVHEGRPFAWSLFNYISSPALLWTVHILALLVFFCLMIGLFSRTAAVLAYLLAVSYAQRVTPGAYFGLDKINCLLAMYLMLGPCGARYSLDRLWRMRRGKGTQVEPSVSANVAVRLLQLHMCIIYFFSGLGKLQGMSWWDGEAVWMSVANLEYQSLDLTWMANSWWGVRLYNLLTHATVFWELTYCFLIWNRFARPWILALAIAVHGGIAIALGMATFGLVMLIGNLAFIAPATVQRVIDPVARRISLALVGTSVAKPAPA
jgi:hypothetical protein